MPASTTYLNKLQKRPLIFISAGLAVVFLILLTHRNYTYHPSIPAHHTRHPRQTDLRSLNQDQCQILFPRLYDEADRARAWYEKNGGIQLADIDKAEKEGNARVSIHRNRLYVKTYNGGWHSRTQAALAALHDTIISSPDTLPDIDLVIQTGDTSDGTNPLFALSRKTSNPHLWLMPDFGFYSWPEALGPNASSWSEVREASLIREWELSGKTSQWKGTEEVFVDAGSIGGEVDQEPREPLSWGAKTSKLLWRGVPMTDIRKDLLKASADQPWADVAEVDWGQMQTTPFLSPAQHCDYKYLAQTEGNSYSGRLKYLLQCRSVIVTHPLEYVQHFHHLFNTDPLSTDRNMVEVDVPLTEHLSRAIRQLQSQEDATEAIASNSWNLFQHYLSPAANDCYYRYVLRAYASAQRFQPELDRKAFVAYESFLLKGSTSWGQG